MKSAIFIGSALAASTSIAAYTDADKTDIDIILLGTSGGPVAHPVRSQPANMLRVGNSVYIVDTGDNISQQLSRASVALPSLDAVFISHMHFDHTLGLGPLMAFSWVKGRDVPLPIYGPNGTKELVRRNADILDIGGHIFKHQLPPRKDISSYFVAHDIAEDKPVVIYTDSKTRVSAVSNSHYSTITLTEQDYGFDNALSYRFDVGDTCVVFTGDTGPSRALDALTKDCDILVSEIADPDSITAAIKKQFKDVQSKVLKGHIEDEHMTAAEVGKLAERSGIQKVILTHFGIGPTFSPETFIGQIRAYYPEGDIILGNDLDTIKVQ
ncbi:MBL fold metallo-hydrolase [Kordiimonas pumila]